MYLIIILTFWMCLIVMKFYYNEYNLITCMSSLYW
jgi:hypothetical protein